MEHKLPNLVYNLEKLISDNQWIHVQRGNDIYIIVDDNTSQQELDAINTIALSHDPSLTESQESKAALVTISSGSTSSKNSWHVIQLFEDVLQTRLNAETLTVQTLYTDWRGIYDNLPPPRKTKIRDYTGAFEPSFNFPEPTPLTNPYRGNFNRNINRYLNFIKLRALT